MLLGACVDEALKRKLLREDNQCEVELVVEDPGDLQGCWKAIRLTCPGTRSVAFRSCVLDYVSSKQLQARNVSTRKPSPKCALYRKAAHGPPLFSQVVLAELKSKVDAD